MLIVNAVFWFVVALLLALVEIEIEGKYGWAEKTKTWYRKRGFFPKLWGKLQGTRPETGYYLFFFLFLIFIFHSGFFFGLSWSLDKEFEILALFFVFAALWDFLWFVFNPNYKIKNYKKEKIWWFNKSYWVFGLFPIDYLNSVALALILSILGGFWFIN